MLVVLVVLVSLFLAAHACGWLARRMRLPPIVGHLTAGIVLGPLVLGRAMGDSWEALFPAELREDVQSITAVSAIIFVFCVASLSLSLAPGDGREVLIVAASTFAVPFVGAVILMAAIPGASPGTAQTLFFATAMGVSAVPVLARIVEESGLQATRIGRVSLASSVVTDSAAWVLMMCLAAVIGHKSIVSLVLLGALGAGLIVGRDMFRGALGHLEQRVRSRLGLLVLIGVLLAAGAVTAACLGLDPIFGAFAAGIFAPKSERARYVVTRVSRVNGAVLLPVFFATTGLCLPIGTDQSVDLALLGLILFVAVAGKLGGVALIVPVSRLRSGELAAVGILLSARGATELIFLEVGRELGLMSSEIYVTMVLMALITTIVSSVWIRRLGSDGRRRL